MLLLSPTQKNYIRTLPVARTLLDRRHYRHFLSEAGFGSYYGVYGSFAEARINFPESKGYDQEELAEEFIPRMHRLFAYDYPVIYWLDRAFSQGARNVFDIGGSVGVHFYAYQKILAYPAGVTWCVAELPAMARVGRRTAEGNGTKNLTFVDSLTTIDVPADIWISAGTLQFIENSRPRQLIESSKTRPKHIILNKLPLYDGDDFVVCQNIGKATYSPTHVFNRAKLIAEFESLGYQLVDSWEVWERRLHITGHPDKNFPTFTGLYFKARDLTA